MRYCRLALPSPTVIPTAHHLCLDITRHLDGQSVSAAIRFSSDSSARENPRRRASDTGDAHALAVLPFKLLNPNASSDTGDDYLGLGLANALITRLAALRRFVVRPTSSILRFQNHDASDPLAAGRELGVSFVFDGRIQRAGEMLRVTAQLLDVESGATRWAQVFDEKSTDVLALQDILTRRVAEALVPHLSRDEREALARRGTNDPEAFEAYLRGRYHWSEFTEEGFAKAITCYYRAIAIDSGYALAYTGVADYYNWLGVYNVLPSHECFAAAKEAARQAITLDPNLAEAHTALGFALVGGNYEWAEGEACHLRALELDANCAAAHVWYSLQLAQEARFDEALQSRANRILRKHNAPHLLGSNTETKQAARITLRLPQLCRRTTTKRINSKLRDVTILCGARRKECGKRLKDLSAPLNSTQASRSLTPNSPTATLCLTDTSNRRHPMLSSGRGKRHDAHLRLMMNSPTLTLHSVWSSCTTNAIGTERSMSFAARLNSSRTIRWRIAGMLLLYRR